MEYPFKPRKPAMTNLKIVVNVLVHVVECPTSSFVVPVNFNKSKKKGMLHIILKINYDLYSIYCV
jgi:hypothetical protein